MNYQDEDERYNSLTAIQKIHEEQMDDVQNQFKSRISQLQAALKEWQLSLTSEIREKWTLKSQLEQEKARFTNEILKFQNQDKEYEFKIREINLEHEETVRFFLNPSLTLNVKDDQRKLLKANLKQKMKLKDREQNTKNILLISDTIMNKINSSF